MQATPFGSTRNRREKKKKPTPKPWHFRNALNTVIFPEGTWPGQGISDCVRKGCTWRSPAVTDAHTHPQSGFGPLLSTGPGLQAHPSDMPPAQARDRSPPCPGDRVSAGTPSPAALGGPSPRAPSRPPPPEAGQRPASPADNDRGRPARGPGHGRSLRSPPPPSLAAPPARGWEPPAAAPAPLPVRTAPRRAGPFSLRHPGRAGAGGGGRVSAGPPWGLRFPAGPRAAAPAVSLGRSCQKARPGRAAALQAGGRADRARRGTLARPSAPRPPPPLTSGWVPRRPCRCSRSPAGSDHALGDSPPSWMGGTRRPRRCGRRRGGTEGGGGCGAGRGAAGAAGEGCPARRGAGGPGGREEGGEGEGEEEQGAPDRARPVCPVPPGPPWEPGRAPPSPGHLRALVSGRDRGQLPLPSTTRSAPWQKRDTQSPTPLPATLRTDQLPFPRPVAPRCRGGLKAYRVKTGLFLWLVLVCFLGCLGFGGFFVWLGFLKICLFVLLCF